ncbi:hypothetical protein Tco_0626301 [Tanacetum coccineum]|uniref:Uncharacterized protein n=1 Tax=Tanacetum coccineum TaxID=301880 RepID=A0ABQ4WJ71_9ASTR
MAQHVIPAAHLVPQYKPIGRCNNYAVLQSIPCSPECKIVGLILLDHCLSHVLTETADVPAVYLQQFWRTVSKKFPNIPKSLAEDYHSIKDNVSLVIIRETDDFKEYETVFMKVDVPMNQPRLVVSTQGTHRITPGAHRAPTLSTSPLVTKKRKQIAGESSSPQKSLKITIKQKQIVKKDDDDSEDRIEPRSHKDNPEVVDDDDDKEREHKDDEMGSLETQTTIPTPLSCPRKILSSDKKTFQELTDIVSNPTTSTSKHSQVKKRISSKYSHLPRALRRMCMRQAYMIQDMERKCVTTAKFWETHNKIDDILHEVVPQIVENVTNDLIKANLKPCIVNIIIEDRDAFRSEVPAFISKEFKAHAPKIIEELFKNHVQSNVIHVHPTTTTSTKTKSSANLQYQLYLKMKRNLQDRANDITLWEALRRKFEKSSTSNTSCREDDFHSHHDEHQDDDAHPEGEKRVKMSKTSKRLKSARDSSSKQSRKDSTTYVSKQQSQHQEWDTWEEENVVNEDEVISKDVTPELIAEFQYIDKRVPTIFDHVRMEATLRDSLSNMSRNAEEYAYHLEQSTNFMKNEIVWESRQQYIPRTIPKTLIFYGPHRNPNEPPRPLYNKDLFFLKYGNTKIGINKWYQSFALRNFDLEVMEFESAHSNTTAKLPILKLGEYEMWVIRIKQYFQIQDYALWEVIENGNSWVLVKLTKNAIRDLTLEDLVGDVLKGKWDHERTKFSLPPLMKLPALQITVDFAYIPFLERFLLFLQDGYKYAICNGRPQLAT